MHTAALAPHPPLLTCTASARAAILVHHLNQFKCSVEQPAIRGAVATPCDLPPGSLLFLLLVYSWFPLGFLWFPSGFLLVQSWLPLGSLLVLSWFFLGFFLVYSRFLFYFPLSFFLFSFPSSISSSDNFIAGNAISNPNSDFRKKQAGDYQATTARTRGRPPSLGFLLVSSSFPQKSWGYTLG